MNPASRVILISIVVSLGAIATVSATEGETGVLHGNFSVVGEPVLNQEIELTYFIEPEIDIPNALMRIDLPSGIELVEGNLTWTGSIEKGKRIEMKSRLKVVETGKWQIDAVSFDLGESSSPSRLDWDVLIFAVTSDEGEVREVTNLQDIEFAEEKLTFNNASTSQSKTHSATSEASITSTVQITGSFKFEDADDGNIKKPVRNAVVKVKDILDITWGEGITDSNGEYSISISVGSPADLHVRVWTDSSEAKVETTTTITYYGNTNTKTVDPANPATWDFGEYFAGSTLYQYQIMYYMQEEHHWIQNNALYTMGKVTTVYPSDEIPIIGDSHGRWPKAVLLYPVSDYIFIPDKGWYAWDHSTIFHEYGHVVMYRLYGIDIILAYSDPNLWEDWIEVPLLGTLKIPAECPGDPLQCPGGHHTPNSVTNSQFFAILEGWAEFMEATVENTPTEVWYDKLGDVDGDGEDNLVGDYVNIESNSYTATNGQPYKWYHGRAPPPNQNGAFVEGAAASIWWDINDSADEANEDQLTMGYDEIFEILKNDKPQDINEFWDRWFDTNDNTPTNYGNVQKMWEIYFAQGINKDTTPPSTPSLISPSGTVGTSTPTFNWSAATDDLSGVDHYHIFVDDDISFGSPEIFVMTPSTSYTPPTALSDSTYYWRVQAVDKAENIGGNTTTWSFTVDTSCVDTTPPPTPTLYDPGGTITVSDYQVDWDDVVDDGPVECKGISHYELQEDGSSSFPSPATYTASDSYYDFYSKPNGTYYYRVRAVDNAGNPSSDWNSLSWQDITVDVPPPPPPPPPTPKWSLIDDFTSESGTAYDNSGIGETWGDWTYYDGLSEAEYSSYVTKVGTKAGRDHVGRFYFGNNALDETLQWLVKSNPSGWDFSYPSDGKWIMYCYNENTARPEYITLKFIDDGSLEAKKTQTCENGTGWQILEFDKPSTGPAFNWANVTTIWMIVDNNYVFTAFRDMYFDDLGWEMDVYLKSNKYVVDPGESFLLWLNAVNKYSDTIKMFFYVDGENIGIENSPTYGETYFRTIEKSHSIPGTYNHTGYVRYNRASDDNDISSNPVEIIVNDNIPPSVSITTPLEGDNLNTQSVYVEWSGSDVGLGIDHYEVKLDTNSWIPKGLVTSHTFTGVSEGLHTVHVKATDKASNNATDSVGFRVDITAPPAPVPSATPSTWTSTNSFSVDWTNPSDASGIVAGAYYKLYSPPTSNTDGNWTTSKPITGITVSGDGSHPIYVWLKDGAGNVDYNNRGSTTLNYDGTSPQAPSSIIWDDGPYSMDTSIVANWGDATDTSGIIDYYLQVDEDSTDFSSGMIFDGGVGSSISTKTLTSADGVADGHTYYYQVKTKNGAGLVSSAWSDVSAGVIVDTTLPSVIVLSPNGNESWEIGTQHNITWTATDLSSGVASIDLYYSTDGGLTYPYTIATGETNDGAYTWTIPNTPTTTAKVKVVAHDAAGYSSYDESDGNFVIADTTLPTITIDSPINITYTTTSIDLNVSANEKIDTWMYSPNSAENITFSPNTTITGEEGLNNIIVYANDTSGNMNSTTVHFTVDTTPPTVENSSTYTIIEGQNETVRVDAWDTSGIDIVLLELDAVANFTMNFESGNTHNYTLISPELGTHNIQYYVNDTAGNMNDIVVDSFSVVEFSFLLHLYPGMNLVSFPVIPKDLNFSKVINQSCTEHNITAVYRRDNQNGVYTVIDYYHDVNCPDGLWYDPTTYPAEPVFEPGMSYWLNADEEFDLEITGDIPSTNQSLNLYSGMNLVGWTSINTVDFSDAITQTCTDYNVTDIRRRNNQNGIYTRIDYYHNQNCPDGLWNDPTTYPTEPVFEPSLAYWFNSTKDWVWEYEP